jgi:hypothetical protein
LESTIDGNFIPHGGREEKLNKSSDEAQCFDKECRDGQTQEQQALTGPIFSDISMS